MDAVDVSYNSDCGLDSFLADGYYSYCMYLRSVSGDQWREEKRSGRWCVALCCAVRTRLQAAASRHASWIVVSGQRASSRNRLEYRGISSQLQPARVCVQTRVK